MNDRELITQILNAFRDGEIDWRNVPALQKTVSNAVNQKIAIDTKKLDQLYEQRMNAKISDLTNKFSRDYNAKAREARNLKKDITTLESRVENQHRQVVITWLVYMLGILCIVLAVVGLAYLAVPAILHGVGIAPVWHWLHPAFTGWGIMRGILGIIASIVIALIGFTLVLSPAILASKWLSYRHDN